MSARRAVCGVAAALAAACANSSGAQKPADAQAAKGAAAATVDADVADPVRSLLPPVVVQDEILRAKFELPGLEGSGWQEVRRGRAARRGPNEVQVDVGQVALAREGTPAACRDGVRDRFAKERDKDAKSAGVANSGAEDKSGIGSIGQNGSAANGAGGSGGDGANANGSNAAGNNATAAKPAVPVLREQAIGDWPTATWSFTRGDGDASVRSRWAFFPRGADCLVLQVSSPPGDKFADATFGQAARTFKAEPLPADRQREVDLMAGMSFLERRELPSALERFEALAQREPSFAKAHFGALMAGFEIGVPAYSRALPHGLAALQAEHELSPEQRQLALRAVGVMQLAENQVRGAAQTLAELVVRAPDLAEGQYNYACALARLGDKPAAVEHLKSAMRLDRDLVAHAKDDDDLKALHDDDGFKDLLAHPPPPAEPKAQPHAPPDSTSQDMDDGDSEAE